MAAAASVTVDTDSAFIEVYHSTTNGIKTRDKSGDDFFSFAESLNPNPLRDSTGTAGGFASQASDIVTGVQPPFPVAPVFGIDVDGRARAEAKKIGHAGDVPVSDPNGSFSADFSSTDPVPFQFSGFIQTFDEDADDDATISVDLSGPFSKSFEVCAGDCPSGVHHAKGFVIEDTLPAGSYNLDVEYDAEVDPESPGSGTQTALAEAGVNLIFFPVDTKITRARIHSRRGSASFSFKAIGNAHGFECALVRGHHNPHFDRCHSPKSYDNLRRGHYKFEVRALGRGGPDASPATKTFNIT